MPFYRRCLSTYEAICSSSSHMHSLELEIVISDNCSTDSTLARLREISAHDPRVTVICNIQNYGPDASTANALWNAAHCDYIVQLCSDLQDPPELALDFFAKLSENTHLDAVFALKDQPPTTSFRTLRRVFYKLVRLLSRRTDLPTGFHGFGLFRSDSIARAKKIWEQTSFPIRLCLATGSLNYSSIRYQQSPRLSGQSSYSTLGPLFLEAGRSLLSLDSFTSKTAFTSSATFFFMTLILSITLYVLWLLRYLQYASGIPTLMAIVMTGFSIQYLLLASLSRQIEEMRHNSFRTQVKSFRMKP